MRNMPKHANFIFETPIQSLLLSQIVTYGKNNLAKVSKNLAKHRSVIIILLNFQNNYVECSS